MRSESTASKSYELNPGRMTYHQAQRTPAPGGPPAPDEVLKDGDWTRGAGGTSTTTSDAPNAGNGPTRATEAKKGQNCSSGQPTPKKAHTKGGGGMPGMC